MRTEFKAQVRLLIGRYDYRVHPAVSPEFDQLQDLAQTEKERNYLWTARMEVYRRWAKRNDPDILPEVEGIAGESWKQFSKTPTFGALDVIGDVHSWLRSLSASFEVQPGISPVPGDPPSIEIACSGSEYDFLCQEWEKAKHIAGAVPVRIVAVEAHTHHHRS